jgi:hypothetical protein
VGLVARTPAATKPELRPQAEPNADSRGVPGQC